MPTTKITPDLDMHYEIDDFADPWLAHETVLLLHGNATENNPLYPVAKVREWQSKIPRSELLALPGNSYHIVATAADRCAQATLDFIRRSCA